MPPSIILEVLKITEAEMDLREATREVEQLRWAMTPAELAERAGPLRGEQESLAVRTDRVGEEIEKLPDAASFGDEIGLLAAAESVMREATALLSIPDTGAPTIAAETEAIELLLRSRAAGGGGGGGGGGTPASSGQGSLAGNSAARSALALVGRGVAPAAVVEPRAVEQSTGDGAPEYPPEFREGLDRYFGELDGGR